MPKSVLSNIKDFKIKDNVLVKYRGKGGDIVIPAGVVEISKKAFWCNKTITSVVVPAGCTNIGGWTFTGCSELKSVTLPASLTKVGYDAFSYCTHLESILVKDKTTKEAKELLRIASVFDSSAIKGEHKTYAVKFEFTKKMKATHVFDVNSAAEAKKAFEQWITKYQDPSQYPFPMLDVKLIEVQEF